MSVQHSTPSLALLTPLACALAACFSTAAQAGGEQELPVQAQSAVVVVGSAISTATAANEGRFTELQLRTRPLLRPAEVLEAVPGLIVTQHSSEAKANQYFLRGFNLDHGTDLRTTVQGVPVNLPTHAHGHGYTDLNFLIPELVSAVRYRKGPYFADEGDFSAAGAVHIDYTKRLDRPYVKTTAGRFGYRQLLAAGSVPTDTGDLLIAAQGERSDGPWVVAENLRARSALLRYSAILSKFDVDLHANTYDARWTSTDQVPLRAVQSGLIGRFGTLDASNGGHTRRDSMSAALSGQSVTLGDWEARAYHLRYRLNLFSNFTYFLSNPQNGDQFEQAERRKAYGLDLRTSRRFSLAESKIELATGLQYRDDEIAPIGLYATEDRARLGTVRQDAVEQSQTGLWAEARLAIGENLRAVLGARRDEARALVAADNPANSGSANASLTSPKASLIYSLPLAASRSVTLFANTGRGFHSNDARGATTRIDPVSGDATEPVTLLVPARGRELGIRFSDKSNGLQSSLSWWNLGIGSELLFIGDAGTTEASRPSKRRGFEWATYWKPNESWTVDVDFARSKARFTDGDPVGPFIPGAIARTASAGVAYLEGPWEAGLRLRYLGPRSLIEDNSVQSQPSTLINAHLGYRLGRHLQISADVLNVANRKVNDIEYFYESQLTGEPQSVADRHVHPGLPRTWRVSLQYIF
jgi:outer membrane receptor for ferrienterochelin and colicin